MIKDDLLTPPHIYVDAPGAISKLPERTRSVKKMRSTERTRTCAEEVARQQRKAERRNERHHGGRERYMYNDSKESFESAPGSSVFDI